MEKVALRINPERQTLINLKTLTGNSKTSKKMDKVTEEGKENWLHLWNLYLGKYK